MDVHWLAVKRVLYYLKGTMSTGLLIQPSPSNTITGLLNADWATNIHDWKSIAINCVFLGNSLISWSSKKQTIVICSSTESKYRALTHASVEVTWIWNLLNKIGFPVFGVPVVWCNTLGAGALAANLVFHAHTKHIEIDIHFVRDQVLKRLLDVHFVPFEEQLADCLTNSLTHN